MSQENVEIVRRFLAADVDEGLAHADPGIVWNPVEELPTQGHDAVRASLAHWKAEWDDYKLVPEEFVDMGDRVVVTVRMRGRGRGSGVEIDGRFYDVYTLRDGKIVRMDQFTDRAEALEAGEPRSERNAETVRRLYETGAIDGQPDVLREVLDPDAVWVNPPEAVDPGTRRGAAEFVAAVENLTNSFDILEHRLHDVFDAGDAVVAFVTFHARGRDSGAEVTQDEAHTWTFRDGKVISFEWSRDLRAALEAVGLSE